MPNSLSDLVYERVPGIVPRVSRRPERWCGRVARAVEGEFSFFDLLEFDPGIHLVRVQGCRCATLPMAIETLANALEFPAYYGRNTDAFHECFNDLLDPTAGGISSVFDGQVRRQKDKLLVIVDTAESFLKDEDQGRAGVLLGLFSDAAQGTWSDHQAELFFVFLAEELPHVVGTLAAR